MLGYAQRTETPLAAWYFPGATWQASPHLKVSGQYGINPNQHLQAGYLQLFLKMGRHITYNPAYLYLGSYGAGSPPLQEHGLMNGLIFPFSVKSFLIEDRNILWNRFRSGAEDLHIYRNRFRLLLPLAARPLVVKPYVFDEVFYLFNRGRWSRNRVAVGVAIDIGHWLNVDLSYIRELDHYNGSLNMVFIMGTLSLYADPQDQKNRTAR
jgi:hypothetical protein